MRWDKAKTLMIALFLLLNVFLGYINILQPYQLSYQRRQNEAAMHQYALTELETAHIVLEQRPSQYAANIAPVLLGSSPLWQPEALAAGFFQGDAYHSERILTLTGDQLWRFSQGEELLEVAADGRWYYRRNPADNLQPVATESLTSAFTAEQAKALAEAFLKSRNIALPKDVHLSTPAHAWQSTAQADEYTIVWCLQVDGAEVFDVELSLSVDADGVRSGYSTLRSVEQRQAALSTNSSGDILLWLQEDSYASQLALTHWLKTGQPLAICEMRLGLFTGLAIANTASPIAAQPAWRIVLHSGETIYMNALNGERFFP